MADFENIIKDSFSQYAGAVIQSRALVDVRDCLKPSARQIFYCMKTDKFTSDKPFKKTLKAIGSAMRMYIHGDASCEGVIMRSAQPFAMRYPLIEVEGSYGNPMETENWAAPRYTASRLSAISNNLFEDVEKNTIHDWRDNYDDTEQYPSVLPTKGYYNIVNGTMGIAVGAAASIPQFNLAEVNNALITLLKNPEATFEDLYCAPDFATGGILINTNVVKESLRIGTGKACMLRAKFEYDDKKNTLTVIEMPYSVYTNTVCKQLEEIVNGENNPGIDRFNDLTGENPCIKIYLSKSANPKYVQEYLYKNTSLQSSFGVNMTMLDEGRYPKVFGWKEALQAHLNHEINVYIDAFNYDLKKIKYRMMIVEGIIKAINNIEEVIQLIKTSSSTSDANKKLCDFLNINEEQAKAILEIKLARLAKLEVNKFIEELNNLQIEADHIETILHSKELLDQEIINGFEIVSKKFGDDRRTQLENIEIAKTKEEKEIATVPPEKCVVIMTEGGSVKRVPTSNFRTQRRNGKGVKTQDDITTAIIRTDTVDSLMVFTNMGKMYRILVNDIPVGTNTSKGQALKTLITMEPNEEPEVIYSLYRDTDAKFVLFATKNGLIKKTSLDEYTKTRKKTGIAAIGFKPEDSLASVSLIKDEDLLILTKKGMVIKIKSTDISPTGKTAMGVKGISLKEDDEVLTCLPIRDATDTLALFSENGLGKRVQLNEITLQNRAGKGVVCSKDILADATLLNENDTILVNGANKSICIVGSEVPELGRAAGGNQIIKDSKIMSVSKV